MPEQSFTSFEQIFSSLYFWIPFLVAFCVCYPIFRWFGQRRDQRWRQCTCRVSAATVNAIR